MLFGWLKNNSSKHGLIGLDIGSGSIKFVEINSDNYRHQLTHFATASIPVGAMVKNEIKDSVAISNILKNLIAQEHIQNKYVSMAIPRSSVIIKMTTVDSRLTTSEIESRAWIEANRQFPELIGGIYLDYQILGVSANDQKQLDLMLVACRKEHIDPYLEVLKQSNLIPERVDINSYAFHRVLSLITQDIPELKTVALLNLDLFTSSLVVIHEKNMIYAHDHSFDGDRLLAKAREYLNNLSPESKLIQERAVMLESTTAEPTTPTSTISPASLVGAPVDNPGYLEILRENIIAQLRHVMHFFYSSHPNMTIQKLVLSGDCVVLPKLEQFVQQELGIETQLADFFNKMDIAIGINLPQLKNEGPSLALASGLSLSDNEGINLLPWREEARLEKKKKFMMTTASFVMMTLLLVVVIHIYISSIISNQVSVNSFLQSQIAAEQTVLTNLQKKKQTIIALKKKITYLMSLQNESNNVVKMFDELVKVTPSTIALSHLASNNGSVVLEGVAQSDLDITLFMQKISESKIFATPELTEINAVNGENIAEKTFQLKVKQK